MLGQAIWSELIDCNKNPNCTSGNLLANWLYFVMLVFILKLNKDQIKNCQYESKERKLENRAFNYKNIGFKTWHKNERKFLKIFIFTEQVRVKGISIKYNIL